MERTEAPGGEGAEPTEVAGYEGLSRFARSLVAATAVGLTLAVVWHLTTAFFFVAPNNTISERYGDTMSDYVRPEFYRAWKLFAPNPVQSEVNIQARAEVRQQDGGTRTTDWYDFTANDLARLRHDPMPSEHPHLLRRAWSVYDDTHDDDGEPNGVRGQLTDHYLHRIVMQRMDRETPVDIHAVERVQVRVVTRRPPPPPWTEGETPAAPTAEELAWRPIQESDLPGGRLPEPAEEGAS